jgi:hypothetical protein
MYQHTAPKRRTPLSSEKRMRARLRAELAIVAKRCE